MREATAKQNPSQSYYSAHEGSFNLLKEENVFYTGTLKAALYGNAGAAAISVGVFSQIPCKWYLVTIAMLSFVVGYILAGISYRVAGYAQGQFKFALFHYENKGNKKMQKFTEEGNFLRDQAIRLNNLSFLMLFIGTIFAIAALCSKTVNLL